MRERKNCVLFYFHATSAGHPLIRSKTMFNRKTLFVLGAGAGFDIDMPVGRTLAEEIARRTAVQFEHGRLGQRTADGDLALNFFECGDPKSNEYAQAFELIHNGVLLANSIDDFLDIHEGSQEVVTVGKSAIVRSILYAELHCKLYVNPSNMYNKLDVSRIRDSWLVKFMQILGPGKKVHQVESALDDVSFITFNYDRCLEYFLRYALQLVYGIDRKQAADIVEKASIIHPYGSVGSLEKVPFGAYEHSRRDCRELSKAIKTYTERVEEQAVLERMQDAIGKAQCIVFLGFAYHKQNMALLKPSRSRNTKQVYGTAYGMSDSDVDEVIDEFGVFFPDHENVGLEGPGSMELPALDVHNNIRLENKLTCSQLFDYYAKSLAG